jgi:hypothetical protein
MRVRCMSFTVAQLRGIPDAERSLVVVLAHALNEINTLNKLLFLCTRFNQEPSWLAHAHAAQAFMVARPLVGKLNEAWAVLQKGYFASKLSKTYDELLEETAANSLKFLKSYFSRTNAVNEVRNNFAFHYSLDQAKTDIPDEATSDDLSIYLHESNGNSLYYFAEYLMGKALMENLVPNKPEEALGELLGEMSEVIANLNEFVQGLLFVVFDKYVGAEVLRQAFQDTELGIVPKSEDIRIPVFFEVSAPKGDGAG